MKERSNANNSESEVDVITEGLGLADSDFGRFESWLRSITAFTGKCAIEEYKGRYVVTLREGWDGASIVQVGFDAQGNLNGIGGHECCSTLLPNGIVPEVVTMDEFTLNGGEECQR